MLLPRQHIYAYTDSSEVVTFLSEDMQGIHMEIHDEMCRAVGSTA